MNEGLIRSITLRPPPGMRFSIFGADCVLQYQKGREKELVEWLEHWVNAYIKPLTLGINPHTQVKEELATVPQLIVDAEDDNFKVALCLSCEKLPITKLSGLCNTCDASAKATVDAITADEINKEIETK